ncbi:hypothetical protein BC829DRAFT_407429 [Chytridium lagenaria]|nr:hypothetical protein BC829DRAFT_407429 [Chytridium lagenaria]
MHGYKTSVVYVNRRRFPRQRLSHTNASPMPSPSHSAIINPSTHPSVHPIPSHPNLSVQASLARSVPSLAPAGQS